MLLLFVMVYCVVGPEAMCIVTMGGGSRGGLHLVKASEVGRFLVWVLLQPPGAFAGGFLKHQPTSPEDLQKEEKM